MTPEDISRAASAAAAPLAGSQQVLDVGEEIKNKDRILINANSNYSGQEKLAVDANETEVGDHFVRRALAQSKRYQGLNKLFCN